MFLMNIMKYLLFSPTQQALVSSPSLGWINATPGSVLQIWSQQSYGTHVPFLNGKADGASDPLTT